MKKKELHEKAWKEIGIHPFSCKWYTKLQQSEREPKKSKVVDKHITALPEDIKTELRKRNLTQLFGPAEGKDTDPSAANSHGVPIEKLLENAGKNQVYRSLHESKKSYGEEKLKSEIGLLHAMAKTYGFEIKQVRDPSKQSESQQVCRVSLILSNDTF